MDKNYQFMKYVLYSNDCLFERIKKIDMIDCHKILNYMLECNLPNKIHKKIIARINIIKNSPNK